MFLSFTFQLWNLQTCIPENGLSASGICYILIQQDNSHASLTTLNHLVETGDCEFKISIDRLQIRSALFRSRSKFSYKEDYRSFVDETSWTMKYHFHLSLSLEKEIYWICDCNYMKKIFEYTRSGHQLHRWSRELFYHDFSIVNHSANMMKDFNFISSNINPIIH